MQDLTVSKENSSIAVPPTWEVYFVRCKDGTLYTGIARDAEKRAKTHNSGRGAKYTRSRLPVTLVYRERCADHSAALRREIALKKLSHAEKEALIALQATGDAADETR